MKPINVYKTDPGVNFQKSLLLMNWNVSEELLLLQLKISYE